MPPGRQEGERVGVQGTAPPGGPWAAGDAPSRAGGDRGAVTGITDAVLSSNLFTPHLSAPPGGITLWVTL